MAVAALAHRGVVLLEPALLPALVPDGWAPAGEVGRVRLVHAGGAEPGTRPFLIAPAEDAPEALRTLAREGARAFLLVGACASPSRAMEPGDLLVVDWARDDEGIAQPHPALAQKLANRCAHRSLAVQRGGVAGKEHLDDGPLAEAAAIAPVLRAGREAGVATAALLVCIGQEQGSAEAPAPVLEAFDRAFGVVQEILGSGGPER